MIEEKDVRVDMRDGARIGLRIYRPTEAAPVPTLFAISPYRYDNNELPPSGQFLWRETGPISWYVEQGYAYVHADVRGTGASEGEFEFFGANEQQDLVELIAWIAVQPWSNGRVGGIGQSYFCMSQWFMAVQQAPALKCIGAFDGTVDPYRAFAYPGGIEGQFLGSWYTNSVRLPNLYPANRAKPRFVEKDLVREVAGHPLYDEYWSIRTALSRLHLIQVPVYAIGAWSKNDFHLPGVIQGFEYASGPKKLMIVDAHPSFRVAALYESISFHREYLLPFYDHYLKSVETSFVHRAEVEYAVLNTGDRRYFDNWPPPSQEMILYLAEGPTGSVYSLNDGALVASTRGLGGLTRYSYPNPNWVIGTATIGPGGLDGVRYNLTFTSDPLREEVEIGGSGRAQLHMSSTRDDIDVVIKVSEQMRDDHRCEGQQPGSRVVTKGWLRASHSERDRKFERHGVPFYSHRISRPIVPGEMQILEVPLAPAAYRFRRGSRIRLEISCGDSQITDPLSSHAYRPDKIGQDTVHHSVAFPSQLILPVLAE